MDLSKVTLESSTPLELIYSNCSSDYRGHWSDCKTHQHTRGHSVISLPRRVDNLHHIDIFLSACCPHDILSGTRMDLGSCPKHHALALRADYEKALDRGKDYDYDIDAMEHLTNFIAGQIIDY